MNSPTKLIRVSTKLHKKIARLAKKHKPSLSAGKLIELAIASLESQSK